MNPAQTADAEFFGNSAAVNLADWIIMGHIFHQVI